MHNTIAIKKVQTPIINLIVNQQSDIASFIPRSCYIVTALFELFKAQTRVEDQATAHKLISRCKGKEAVVVHIFKKLKKAKPPALYDLTSQKQKFPNFFYFTTGTQVCLQKKAYKKT